MRRLLILAFLATPVLAADARPVSVVKITGGDEAYDADVGIFDGVKRLRVETDLSVSAIPVWAVANIRRTAEVTPAKAETDLSTPITVSAGKKFAMTMFAANLNEQNPTIIRLKKQTGGAGAWATVARLTLKMHGQDASDVDRASSLPTELGSAGDVFKLTQESALAKGSLWVQFAGVEY